MVEIGGKRWKNEQFRWQFWVFLLVIPLITPPDLFRPEDRSCRISVKGAAKLSVLAGIASG